MGLVILLRPSVRATKAGAFLLRRAPPAVAASLARLRERECELGFRAARFPFPFRVDFLGWTRTACLCDTNLDLGRKSPHLSPRGCDIRKPLPAAFACQFLLMQVGDCPSYRIQGFCFPSLQPSERERHKGERAFRPAHFFFFSSFISVRLLRAAPVAFSGADEM